MKKDIKRKFKHIKAMVPYGHTIAFQTASKNGEVSFWMMGPRWRHGLSDIQYVTVG